MKIETSISIIRQSNDEIHIRVQDHASQNTFLDISLTLEQFALAVTGVNTPEVTAEVRNLSNVGKRKQIEPRSVLCPLKTYDKKELQKWLLDNCKEAGWEIDAYLGSRHSVRHSDDGVTLNYTVAKYDDTEANT